MVVGGERFYPQQRCFEVFKYVIGSIGQKVNNWAQNIANTIDHTRGNFLLVLATIAIRRLGGRLPVNANRRIGTGLVILTITNLVLDHAGTVSIRDIIVFKIYNRRLAIGQIFVVLFTFTNPRGLASRGRFGAFVRPAIILNAIGAPGSIGSIRGRHITSQRTEKSR